MPSPKRSSKTARERERGTTHSDDTGAPRVEWGVESPAESWHFDSQIAPAEALSELPEPVIALEDDTDADRAEEEEDDEHVADDEALAESGSTEKRRGRRKSRTIARKQMLRERRRMLARGDLLDIVDYERPVTRVECRDAMRPCLYVSCRYHLFLDVNPATGSIKINFPDKEIWELEQTCALDVAARGGITLEEVGEIMNLTRERIRQVEVSGLDKMRTGDADLCTFLDGRELDTVAQPPRSSTP